MPEEPGSSGTPPSPPRSSRHRGSSFGMQDPDLVFAALALGPGHRFLDLGCGPGEYSLYALPLVGPTGVVHALDLTWGPLKSLAERAAERGFQNLVTYSADVRRGIPLPDGAVDACLAATVLHDKGNRNALDTILAEVRRVLAPGGRLAVVEINGPDAPIGPPLEQRIAPDELTGRLATLGFGPTTVLDLGNNYLLSCRK